MSLGGTRWRRNSLKSWRGLKGAAGQTSINLHAITECGIQAEGLLFRYKNEIAAFFIVAELSRTGHVIFYFLQVWKDLTNGKNAIFAPPLRSASMIRAAKGEAWGCQIANNSQKAENQILPGPTTSM